MPGPTTEFLHHETREIRDVFLKTRVGLVEIRTEVRMFSGIVGIFGALTFIGLVSGIWWAATLSSRVGNLETRFDQIDTRLDKIDARFDRLEASIAKALAKP